MILLYLTSKMNERFFLLKDRAQVVMEKKLLGLLIRTDFKLYCHGVFLLFYSCYLKNTTNMQMLSIIVNCCMVHGSPPLV